MQQAPRRARATISHAIRAILRAVPRFLDPSGTKFWEITRTGAVVARRSGSVGKAGRSLEQRYPNALLARWHYRNMVGRKTHSERYRPDPDDRDAPPPAAAAPPPDDPAELLVYADWLQTQGDPRGELIALQQAGNHRAAGELLERAAAQLLGEAAEARELFAATWERGFVRELAIGHSERDPAHRRWLAAMRALLPDVPACYLHGVLLETLFASPSLGQLRDIVIGSAGTADFQDTMLALCARAPATLRRVVIAADSSREGFLATLTLPGVEEFACDLRLAAAAVAQIAEATWPRLRRLAIFAPDPELALTELLRTRLIEQLERLAIRTPLAVGPALVDEVRRRAPALALDLRQRARP